MPEENDANNWWRGMLGAWAIPAELIDAAPASPHSFDPAVFVAGRR